MAAIVLPLEPLAALLPPLHVLVQLQDPVLKHCVSLPQAEQGQEQEQEQEQEQAFDTPGLLPVRSEGGIAAMRALSDVASMTGKEPVPQASGECDPSGLSPNACRFCSVKVPGYDSPHSTHKVSAIRPETSSKKQWSDKEIVLVAMVGQANHCIQQHVALAQLPLGAHRGVGLGSNKAPIPPTMRSSLYGCCA